jgi:selenocysteine lyase/cysteine desulfurase
MKSHFSKFLVDRPDRPDRLHFAAHSHHPWPDVTLQAQGQAWLDAAELMDDKWDRIFDVLIPEGQRHIAGRLHLSDPTTIAFAPSVHSLLMRLLSCLPSPVRILTTDAEFHSFTRQVRRLEEDGLAVVDRVTAEPFSTFPERLASRAAGGGHDLVYFSHVHFNSGYMTPDLRTVVQAVKSADTFVVIDAYHGFMALPTDLSAIEDRAFYTAGGYKYAMSGEGVCFLHCPAGYATRPVDTGWFAGFGDLTAPPRPGLLPYPADGRRFLGGTFDATGLYRFNAVQRWLDGLGLSVSGIHEHVRRLQAHFLANAETLLEHASLVPGRKEVPDRGHFLTFKFADAGTVYERLHAAGVITDLRGDRLRIGFGIYHDEADVDELLRRLGTVLVSTG